MRKDVTQWIDQCVMALRHHLSDDRLGSVTVFGSLAGEDGPQWNGSDLDILIVPQPHRRVDADFLASVSRALQNVTIPYPLSPVVYNWDEVENMVGPLTGMLYARSARTVWGPNLIPRFEHVAASFSIRELQRSALCALSLSRLHLRTIGATILHWDALESCDISTYQTILRECLGVIRVAFWVVSGTFPNDFPDVLPLAQVCFASIISSDCIEMIWRALRTEVFHPQLLIEAFSLTEILTNYARATFHSQEQTTNLLIDMSF